MNDPSSAPPDAAPFLVLVYPQDASKPALMDLATRLHAALLKACGDAPVQVRPNVTTLCLLAHGRFDRIQRAVDEVTDAYSHWLVVRVDTPHAGNGLSTALQWLRRHC